MSTKKQVMVVKEAIVRNTKLYQKLLEMQVVAGVNDNKMKTEIAANLANSILEFAELVAILPDDKTIELLEMFEQSIGIYASVSRVGMVMSALGFSDEDCAISMLETEAIARQKVFGEDMTEALVLIHQNMGIVDLTMIMDNMVELSKMNDTGDNEEDNEDNEVSVQLDMFTDPTDFDPCNN